eukprot:TRINITY_DN3468_c0_g1_i1.p1 TRINITY_DN3468_c0_g1~~TRINITY_DN3468_c0_g1_i1.p1  ORF type:complete len:265 (-),score=39.21 TRINITY_DN3468_c0_g1_i1:307-1101(-)
MVGRSHFVFLFVVLCFSWTNMPPETRPFEFDRVREWGIAGSFLNFNTFSIWYRDTAQVDKPAMLFVHGFPTSSFDFVDIWDDLCKDYRCIAVDSLGFGFSSKPDRYNYTITEQADIHEAVVLSLPQTSAPIDLVCHDYGVSICQELLARYEELKSSAKIQIRSVAFLNGGLIPDAHHPLMIQRVLTVPILGPLLSRLSTQYFFDSYVMLFAIGFFLVSPYLGEFCSPVDGCSMLSFRCVFAGRCAKCLVSTRDRHASFWINLGR